MNIQVPDFSLPNAAAGPDPFSLSELSKGIKFVALFFQRDHYCTNCRKQVQKVAHHYDAFRVRNAEAVSIVPEPLDKVKSWQERYDLPYPLLADPSGTVSDRFNQPVRFGILGEISDFFGRMPQVVIVDLRGEHPEAPYVFKGSSTFDRPNFDDLLAELDSLRE